jgi:hypothetical protein
MHALFKYFIVATKLKSINNMAVLSQFFNRNYQTPEWFKQKKMYDQLREVPISSAIKVGAWA